MKKSQVKKHSVGTAKYVIAHAKWQASRGRNPSEPYMHKRNPREALLLASKFSCPSKIVEYTINGKKLELDVNKIHFDFFRENRRKIIEEIAFENLLEALQSKKIKTDDNLREHMIYLQRWKEDAPRKRSLRKMRKEGIVVLTSDALFEENSGEDIIDCLENTGLFVDYLLNEIFEEEEPVDTIRKMNPGKHIPTGAELAAELSREN